MEKQFLQTRTQSTGEIKTNFLSQDFIAFTLRPNQIFVHKIICLSLSSVLRFFSGEKLYVKSVISAVFIPMATRNCQKGNWAHHTKCQVNKYQHNSSEKQTLSHTFILPYHTKKKEKKSTENQPKPSKTIKYILQKCKLIQKQDERLRKSPGFTQSSDKGLCKGFEQVLCCYRSICLLIAGEKRWRGFRACIT